MDTLIAYLCSNGPSAGIPADRSTDSGNLSLGSAYELQRARKAAPAKSFPIQPWYWYHSVEGGEPGLACVPAVTKL
jgi:hypothetical protein